MRIWPNSAAMAARGLTVADVQAALRRENIELPGGSHRVHRSRFHVRVERGFQTAEQFAQLALSRGDDGHVVRLGEVARVALDSAERRSFFRGNGQNEAGAWHHQDLHRELACRWRNRSSEEIARINGSLPQGMSMGIDLRFHAVHRRRGARGLQHPGRGDRAGAAGDLAVPGQLRARR